MFLESRTRDIRGVAREHARYVHMVLRESSNPCIHVVDVAEIGVVQVGGECRVLRDLVERPGITAKSRIAQPEAGSEPRVGLRLPDASSYSLRLAIAKW